MFRKKWPSLPFSFLSLLLKPFIDTSLLILLKYVFLKTMCSRSILHESNPLYKPEISLQSPIITCKSWRNILNSNITVWKWSDTKLSIMHLCMQTMYFLWLKTISIVSADVKRGKDSVYRLNWDTMSKILTFWHY